MALTMSSGERLQIEGVVQGVGFRPRVWQLASEQGIRGRVWNEGGAVVIELWGETAQRDAFVAALQGEPPPLASIRRLQRLPLPGGEPPTGFVICESRAGALDSGLSPDAALCDDCLQELYEPTERRFHYPLINCTHCGPRYTITRALPYDRHHTSMDSFALCEACAAEYGDPASRRFHAQATACPQCGPQVWLVGRDGGELARGEGALHGCVERLAAGEIVALKGVGGFHLACDAMDEEAVQRLRRRKQRPAQPFAVMVRDLEMAETVAQLDAVEAAVLQSGAAPIVLLQALPGSGVAAAVAPGFDTLGVMLAYSGLHHLLLQSVGRPLVMTSGNLHDAPLVADNSEALQALAPLADALLLHDRPIINRVDDSVVRVIAAAPRLLRRARGYVPQSLPLPPGLEAADGVLAMGGEMKGSFCLLHRGRALLSPHLGELSGLENYERYRQSLASEMARYGFIPRRIVIDAHPDYRASRHGEVLAEGAGAELIRVQHHHAHLVACMAEHGLPLGAQVVGVVLDGLGYGDDGTLWGGEFMLADYRGYRRLAAFDAVPLPGGDAANREPWRNAVAHLQQALGWDEVATCYGSLAVIERLQQKPLTTLQAMMANSLNAPLSSSCGRLFDAVAALLQCCFDGMSYEAEAAMALEQLAGEAASQELGYPYECVEIDGVVRLRWAPLWRALLDDLMAGVAPARVAARFHQGVVDAVAEQAAQLARAHGLEAVVLSGGVLQNRIIAEGLLARLSDAGLRVLLPQQLPANDGGIALGQALVAAARAEYQEPE